MRSGTYLIQFLRVFPTYFSNLKSVLNEILNLIESVSEDFPSYSLKRTTHFRISWYSIIKISKKRILALSSMSYVINNILNK